MKKRKEYTVKGECRLSITNMGGKRTIRKENIKIFWENYGSVKNERGVYIFALTWRDSFVPYYVGKASGSFKNEIFAPHKLSKYKDILTFKGTPVLFFIIQQGWKNDNINKKVEALLTVLCYRRNKKN